ncbi:MAG: Beta sliding clamp [Chlamydiales bacterium]|nr:Beta sliding clamp [Chlamydiales bacterium]MCH9636088.1 Beta sliding clamp [Chlamydiales bacterium]MCH9703155.1 DNA polymerase III subunit beta [Chlamydiota bacterium]
MKFVVSRAELSNLIRKIQNIVPQNAPIPVLSHFLIEAKGNELVFTATDLVVGTRCAAEAKIFEPGALSIPSKRFFQLVRELTDAQIEVNGVDGEMAEIKSGSSRFRLHGMDKSEYPTLPDLQEAVKFTIPGEQLKEMFYRTAFAVSREDNRYVLTGVLMRLEAGNAIFVGTDGKRLAKVQNEIALNPEVSGEYIIPLKAVEEMIKMIDDESDCTVYVTDDKVGVESGNSILVTKLLSGEYPDFEQVIASQSEVKMQLHREELIVLLRQISLFTTNTSQSVRFTFSPGELTLTANCTDVGEGKVSMPVNYEGEKMEIAFNPFFFLDILRHSRDETVTLGVSDSFNPGVITDSTNGLFIIMPMRLNED